MTINSKQILDIIEEIALKRKWSELEKGVITHMSFGRNKGYYVNIARLGIPTYVKHSNLHSTTADELYKLKYFKTLYKSSSDLGSTKYGIIEMQYNEFLDQCIVEIVGIELKKMGVMYHEIKDFEFRFYSCKTAYVENYSKPEVDETKRVYKIKKW